MISGEVNAQCAYFHSGVVVPADVKAEMIEVALFMVMVRMIFEFPQERRAKTPFAYTRYPSEKWGVPKFPLYTNQKQDTEFCICAEKK